PAAGDLDLDQRVRRQVEAEAAVFLGDRHAEEPELLHLLDEGLRVPVLVLVLGGDGDHLPVDPVADRVDELGLLGDGHAWTRSRSRPRTSCCSSTARIVCSSASAASRAIAMAAFSRNFASTSSLDSGFSGPAGWGGRARL